MQIDMNLLPYQKDIVKEQNFTFLENMLSLTKTKKQKKSLKLC